MKKMIEGLAVSAILCAAIFAVNCEKDKKSPADNIKKENAQEEANKLLDEIKNL
ncbi:MAG: hypothetical protein OEZ34_05970 [Spirochaetia bacterium]|nr:hypothetical protein [Spirochaetia bacterium]